MRVARSSFAFVTLLGLLVTSGRLYAAPQLARVSDFSFDGVESDPSGFSSVGSAAYMIRAGRGLIRTDGTEGGTVVISGIAANVMPGPFTKMVGLGSKVFWLGVDHALWVSDGTGAGTRWLWRGESISPSPPFVLGGSLYFFADGALYRSDGTAANTRSVTDLAVIGEALVVGSIAYVPCLSAQGASALCATDGTGLGTRVVATLPSSPSLAYRAYGAIGGRVLVANTAGLWGVDVASGAVSQLLNPGLSEGLVPTPPLPVVLNGFAYFPCVSSVGTELCRTDGSAAGTSVLDLYPGAGNSSVPYVARLGDRLVLGARRGALGRELYSSDGTVAGTTLITELGAGALDGVGLSHLVSVGDTVYFAAHSDPFTLRLARTDGTAQGTRILHTQGVLTLSYPVIAPVLADSAVVQGKLLFSCFGIPGLEPWVSDGTTTGTGRLAAVVTPAPSPTVVRAFHVDDRVCLRTVGELVSLGNADASRTSLTVGGVDAATPTAVYYASLGEFRRTDCNGRDDLLVDGIRASFDSAAALGNRVVLRESSGRVWFSDGTAAGTAASNLTRVSFLARAGDTIWMLLGMTLLKSDGTYDGSIPIAQLDNSTVTVRGIATFGRYVALVIEHGDGTWLWRIDGTNAARLKRMATAEDRDAPVVLYAWNDILYFGADEALWRTDGTAGGTRLVKSVAPVGSMAAWGDQLFFSAAGPNGAELWRTDGTNAGTVEVADILPGPQPSTPHDLFVQRPNGPLMFTAETPELGRELWSLSEPAGKPSLFVDMVVGPESSGMVPVFQRNDTLYFYASMEGRGTLWRTGGIDGPSPPDPSTDPSLEGCGCTVDGSLSRGGVPALIVALGWLLRRRRTVSA